MTLIDYSIRVSHMAPEDSRMEERGVGPDTFTNSYVNYISSGSRPRWLHIHLRSPPPVGSDECGNPGLRFQTSANKITAPNSTGVVNGPRGIETFHVAGHCVSK